MKDNNPSNLTPHHYKLSFFVDLGGKKRGCERTFVQSWIDTGLLWHLNHWQRTGHLR